MKMIQKMLFNLKSKQNLRNLKKVGEALMEENKQIITANILHEVFAKEKVTWRKTVGLKENHSTKFVKNLDMQKNLVV